MDKNNLHPVDEFFLSKVNEVKEDVIFKKENWKKLSARLDENSANGNILKRDSNKNLFRVSNLNSIILLFSFSLITALFFYSGSRYNLPAEPEEINSADMPDLQIPLNEEHTEVSGTLLSKESTFLPPAGHLSDGPHNPGGKLPQKVIMPMISTGTPARIDVSSPQAVPLYEEDKGNESEEFQNEFLPEKVAKDSIFIFW